MIVDVADILKEKAINVLKIELCFPTSKDGGKF